MSPPTSLSSFGVELTEKGGDEEIKRFLDTFTGTLHSLRISKLRIFRDICASRQFLEILLRLNSLDTTPVLITHIFILLNHLSKVSSSTIFNSLRLHHENIEIIQALLSAVDANAIKILLNHKTTSNCANEVINERMKEIENLKSKLRDLSSSLYEQSITSTESSQNNLNIGRKTTKKHHKIIMCRKNVASILRTGALISKKMKINDAIVDRIIAGGNNPFPHETHTENIIQMKHKRDVDEIQRRHLLGLISSEEAKIAKIDAIKCKQKAVCELKKEKNRLRNVVNEEFERSVSASKVIIRKIRLSRLIAKKKKFDVVSRKKIAVDEMKKIRTALRHELNVINEEEMRRKIKLIREIRLLESKKKKIAKRRNLNGNYMEMSMDELRASIANLQQQLQHERESRQTRIFEERNRHKQLIQKTETMIEVGRKLYHQCNQMRNEKVKRQTAKKLSDAASSASDLMELREKLVHVRKIAADGEAS